VNSRTFAEDNVVTNDNAWIVGIGWIANVVRSKSNTRKWIHNIVIPHLEFTCEVTIANKF
jgi:hypothetical protein